MNKNIASLVFQPIVSLKSETGYRIVGHEILTRFKGFDTQAAICSLEKSGDIVDFERVLINKALQKASGSNVPLSVNVSNASISDETFLHYFESEMSNISNPNLNIEITETHAPDIRKIYKFIDICHRYNINVGLDDFGSGHANMDLVKNSEFDFIKIDGGLTRSFETNFDSRMKLLEALEYASDKKMSVTIEYLEKPSQILLFESLGIDKGQGYMFGEPRSEPYNDQEVRANMIRSRIPKSSNHQTFNFGT